MKSGLEGRNNPVRLNMIQLPGYSLNEVRPRRPEQFCQALDAFTPEKGVSMKSGLEGRNTSRNCSDRRTQ